MFKWNVSFSHVSVIQVAEIVFSKDNHLFQCTQDVSISGIICIDFWTVVLHKKDAVHWEAQILAKSVDLSVEKISVIQ